MKLVEAQLLFEARGKPSFNYKFWFWGRKNKRTYGIGYARNDIELDIRRVGAVAEDSLKNINNVVNSIEKGEKLEIVEKQIKPNLKRLEGIVDLFTSPIIIFWLNNDKPSVVVLPQTRNGDVTDENGKHIDLIKLFRSKNTRSFLTEVLDWGKIKINDKEGDTVNTALAKFISSVFKNDNIKNIRSLARGTGIESVLSNLHIIKDSIEVIPFREEDYALIPSRYIGSKRAPLGIKEIIKNNFAKLLKHVVSAFSGRR